MKNKMGDSNNKVTGDFDIKNELSTLVAKNLIPSRIAEKLEKKLKEKNVKITKEQLHSITYKIRDIINDYAKSDRITGQVGQPKWEGSDADMQKLVETIENLEKRITNIESGKPSDFNVVTTEDIRIPPQDWDLDPLKEVPSDPESIIVLMKWLQYLLDKCGRDNLSNILDYYVDIGWISQDAKISLIDYSQGITEEEKKGEIPRKSITDLPSKDHIQSFIFIQKLKGRRFDKHFIDRIDGELARITKKLDNYQFK